MSSSHWRQKGTELELQREERSVNVPRTPVIAIGINRGLAGRKITMQDKEHDEQPNFWLVFWFSATDWNTRQNTDPLYLALSISPLPAAEKRSTCDLTLKARSRTSSHLLPFIAFHLQTDESHLWMHMHFCTQPLRFTSHSTILLSAIPSNVQQTQTF